MESSLNGIESSIDSIFTLLMGMLPAHVKGLVQIFSKRLGLITILLDSKAHLVSLRVEPILIVSERRGDKSTVSFVASKVVVY